jgi:hypothetical protein
MWALGVLIVAQAATSTSGAWTERFSGSRAGLEVSTTVATLVPDLWLSYDPTVEVGLVLLPRFALAEDWVVDARWSLGLELTNSATTDLENELEVSDLSVGLSWRGLPRPFGVVSTLRLDVTLPLAEATRASSLVLAPALGASVARRFEVGAWQLDTGASVSYRRPLYEFTTPGVDVPRDVAPQCFGGSTGCAEQLTGVANARDVVSWGLDVSGRWHGLSPGLAWRMTHVVPYALRSLPGVAPLGDATGLRVSTYFAAFVSYDVVDAVSVELGYRLARSALGEDGQLGNPLWDRYQDARVYVASSWALE